MEEVLHGRVIGQEEAVSAISRAIRRARVGLKNPNRPIASFIFAGPTGVGKSELAKTLASYYFGSEDAMVRVWVCACACVMRSRLQGAHPCCNTHTHTRTHTHAHARTHAHAPGAPGHV